MKRSIQDIKREVVSILRHRGVKRAALFGSFVKGGAKKDSDIDILIEFKRGKTLFNLAGLKIELEEVLGRKVDLVEYSILHPLLKDKILEEQAPIL